MNSRGNTEGCSLTSFYYLYSLTNFKRCIFLFLPFIAISKFLLDISKVIKAISKTSKVWLCDIGEIIVLRDLKMCTSDAMDSYNPAI